MSNKDANDNNNNNITKTTTTTITTTITTTSTIMTMLHELDSNTHHYMDKAFWTCIVALPYLADIDYQMSLQS